MAEAIMVTTVRSGLQNLNQIPFRHTCERFLNRTFLQDRANMHGFVYFGRKQEKLKRQLDYYLLLVILVLNSCGRPQEKISETTTDLTSDSLIVIADRLWDKGKLDSAFLVFGQARELAIKYRDSFNLANALANMGILANDQGDSFNGQEYSIEALRYLNPNNKKHHRCILANLNNLGITAYDLKKYEDAIDFYGQAIPFVKDSSHLHITKNNLANAYRQKGNYAMAIKLYQEVLGKTSSAQHRARTLTNLAKAQLMQNPSFNPATDYLHALQLRKKVGDQWGQNSSYSHLTDYYLFRRPDSALYYSQLMYQLALELKNPDNELEAIGKLAELDPTKRLSYFKRYRKLDDSLSSVRSAAKNQFALIRYQTEKHKSDKLKLEQENEHKKVQIERRNALLALAVVTILAIGAISATIYRHRKRRMAEQAEKQIKESKLKTSKEIHDVVANGLYRMMSEVEYSESIDKPKLIGQIEKLYNQSRQISHAVSANPMDFIERVEELILSFSNHDTKILTVGLDEKLNTELNVTVKDEIILAIQELLVNMRKHSNANQVVLRFALQEKQLEIQYRDNGIGLLDEKKDGTGIRNTESRIAALKGLFIFGNHGNGGVQATIRIPLT